MGKLVFSRFPRTDGELHAFIKAVWGINVPRDNVCPDHIAPFDALAEAYFGRTPMSIWRASRGLGGKSFMLGTLSLTEAVTYGVEITVLGGSAAQSMRVHECTQMLWAAKNAPRSLLVKEPTRYETKLRNKSHIRALMASTRSVRGPHPARLRLDEIDEMDLNILESALGQPMPQRGIESQTVCSSTHQYPDGTVTAMLKRAGEHPEWGNHVWCISVNTTVETSNGNVPIQSVRAGDLVLTRQGWKEAQHATCMGYKQTIRLVVGDSELVLTADHLVATPTGWKQAGELREGDEVVTHDGYVSEGRVPVRSAEGCSGEVVPVMLQQGACLGSEGFTGGASRGEGFTLQALRSEDEEPSLYLLQEVLGGGGTSLPQHPAQGHTGRETGGATSQLRLAYVEDGGEGGRTSDGAWHQARAAGTDRDVRGGLLLATDGNGGGGLRLASRQVQRGARQEEGGVPSEAPRTDHSPLGFGTSVVAAVHQGEVTEVWDIGVHGAHEFVAHGIVVHNCYRESMGTDEHPGWLDPVEVQRKKAIMPKAMWDAEFEMQEPSFEGRAIDEDSINYTFDPALGVYKGEAMEYIVTEGPDAGCRYITGVDWAKEKDWTVIRTFRDEGMQWREIAFERVGRISWPAIVARVNERCHTYPGVLVYDNTGLGNVVGDYLALPKKMTVIPIDMLGRRREVLFNEYISAIEGRNIKCPRIDFSYTEHRYATSNDLYGSGHPPDSLVAGALAWHARNEGRSVNIPPIMVDAFSREQSPWRF